ncbi:MAG: hypothetical protein EXR05_05565 [Acetobacteraceae bacterium]|nr:hypothetical protein [Acetobacteraceae bacterium]
MPSTITCNNQRSELSNTIVLTLPPGERLESQACGGGSYGDPLLRAPDSVAKRAAKVGFRRPAARHFRRRT